MARFPNIANNHDILGYMWMVKFQSMCAEKESLQLMFEKIISIHRIAINLR